MPSVEIQALQRVKLNWNWVVSLEDVWSETAFDVPEIHAGLRAEFASRLDELSATTDKSSPLGWVIAGRAGTGKTHLLGRFHAECAARGATFVLVDMTDVRDFWDTVLLGYCNSLQQPGKNGKSQAELLVAGLLSRFRTKDPTESIISTLKHYSANKLGIALDRVVAAAFKQFPAEAQAHGDVVRAVIALQSDDFRIANTAYTWLTGVEIESEDRKPLGLTKARGESSTIVRGLSWLTSLRGPTVIALDQLDPIVTQRTLERDTLESNAASVIINKLGAGLMELRDVTRRTLTVVSCIEQTWATMKDFALKSSTDRFEDPRVLAPNKSGTEAGSLLAKRTAPAFKAVGFQPRYPTWPFKPEWLRQKMMDSPREVLRSCHEHISECVRRGEVREIPPGWAVAPPPPPPAVADLLKPLDDRFAALRKTADVAGLLDEANEDSRFGEWIRVAVRCCLAENQMPDDVDAVIDEKFAGAANSKPFHARLRLIFPSEGAREEHVCLRALQKKSGNALIPRLRSAITQAGIDKALPYRRLVVFRTHPHPGGTVTAQIIEKFGTLGGVWLKASDDDLSVVDALGRMEKEKDPKFAEWLRSRQPASKTAAVREALKPLFQILKGRQAPARPQEKPPHPAAAAPTPATSPAPMPMPVPGVSETKKVTPPVAIVPPDKAAAKAAAKPAPAAGASAPAMLLLGHPLIADKPSATAKTMPIQALQKHGVIFAGAGSGKTVLLKRLIEEAALLGVPSIVVDPANDLASLGDPWDAAPPHWGPDDAARAAQFRATVECVVWTPGKEGGNPMTLEPLPDLNALVSAPEEFKEAVAMAVDALTPVTGIKPADAKKKAVLTNALVFLGKNGDCNLDGLGAVLRDFPQEATTKIASEQKLAAGLADELSANLAIDPMLGSTGQPLDPDVLLTGPAGKTRVSILSLTGLPSLEQQQRFIGQLAMILFSWIKKNPKPADVPLRGLLVIDEARDFVPSGKGSPCLASVQRLAAQARKYGFGVVFANQDPKGIDNKIVANCSTQWLGKMNSPAAIDTAVELLRGRGCNSGDDVGSLKTGRFYVSNADHLMPPTKLATPMCLSAHGGPLTPEAVMEKAAASRIAIRA